MTETMQLTDIGITPRKASQFAAKGICSVQDLLMFYPTKYLDFRNPISLADGKQYAGQHVAVRGQVVSTRVINGKHFMLRLSDGNNFCSVFWFNQSYRARQFSVGQMLAVGGVASWSDEYKSLTISAPDFVSCDLQTAFCIKPIYRKIKGMSDEYLLDAIALALPYIRKCVSDPLTEEQRNALRVPELARCVRMAHAPQDETDIMLSRRRRAVDILYPFCYGLEVKKAEAAKVSPFRIKNAAAVVRKAQNELPFELTEDQNKAVRHVLEEMQLGNRVDALVQGDVGCGKTVVAQIAALGMAMNGYQCAVMCPTLVLAGQHYDDFTNFLAKFGYTAVFLHGGMKVREEKAALAKIASGEANVVVGTHSIFSDKVKFKKLGLTIVDEEHRFGVEQREGLKQKAKEGVHNISMSATPILLADLDVDTKATYQAKLEAVLKESYRLLSIGAGETDFSNVLLDSNEIAKCVPTPLENEDDVTTAEENARKKAIGASVTNVSVTHDDTLEGYPDAYTYRLDGNDGIVMDVKIKVSTTNGDARVKATINMRLINGAWKVVSIDSSKDIFTELSVLDPEW